MRFDEFAINEGIRGSLRVLAEYGMISKHALVTKKKKNTICLANRKWLRARKGGIFTSHINNGEAIEKDQVMGYITDAYGNRSNVIKAPFDGYVFCINNHPLVTQGDALFHIGKEINND